MKAEYLMLCNYKFYYIQARYFIASALIIIISVSSNILIILKKRIVIIEDNELMVQSLTEYINATTSHDIVLTCGSVEAFLSGQTARMKPDIMFLDIGLPGISGIEGIPQILELVPDLDIIVLSTYEESDAIYDALCAGACSYVSKRNSLVKVMEALEVVANGGSYMSPLIAKKISNYFRSLSNAPKVELSSRQKEIIKYMAEGIKLSEVAERCSISHNTVKTHVKRIYETLNINNKSDLLKKYYKGDI